MPRLVGLSSLGTLLACGVAFFYSLADLRARAPRPVSPLPAPTFDFVVFDSVVIGAFVALSVMLSQLLQLPKAYWAPVSFIACSRAHRCARSGPGDHRGALHRTVLGCVVGLAGGVCLHSARFRAVVGAPMRRLARAAPRLPRAAAPASGDDVDGR